METQNLNTKELKELPKKNQTSFVVLKDFSERQRIRRETDIDRNALVLLQKGHKVNPEQYMQLWKDLETLGAGVIVWGRNGNTNRFKWNYSLKDVGTTALNPDDEKNPMVPVGEAPKAPATKPKRAYKKRSRRGRPKGSKNKDSRQEPIPGSSGVILTVRDTEGKLVSISFETARDIANRVAQLLTLVKAA